MNMYALTCPNHMNICSDHGKEVITDGTQESIITIVQSLGLGLKMIKIQGIRTQKTQTHLLIVPVVLSTLTQCNR